jgi:outer membrane protein assembly factor BamA
MDALKNILVLTSVIIGLAAISAFAEEQVDTVFGPKAAGTVEQSEKTEGDKDTSERATKPLVDAMLLVRKISFEGVKTASEDMLRTLIQTQIGHEVSEELLTEDLKSLYKDTGFFSELEVNVRPVDEGGLEIVYKVVESPKISGINIIGNEN